ncbi:MAG TPA: DUF2510 domain-containing protein, partial [Microlunatus sp.]|nr:DUF2510 domain-containing protein [Microlunatus sp.]
MSAAPGWYPDPGGRRGRYRFWDGRAWSATTTATPPVGGAPESHVGPAGVGPAGVGQARHGSAGPGHPGVSGAQVEPRHRGRAVAVIAAVTLLIGVGVVVLGGAGALGGDLGPGGGSTPTICPPATSSAGEAPAPSGDRVVSGRLSYPRLP